MSMKRPSPEIRDIAMARLQSAVSHTPVLEPWVTHSDAPNYVSSHWHVLKGHADIIPEWLRFPGDRRSGPIPRWYRSAGKIGINAVMLRAEQAQLEEAGKTVVHAVSYRAGSKALLGLSRDPGAEFEPGPSGDVALFELAMRLGHDESHFTAGLATLEDRKFYVFPGSLTDLGTIPVEDLTAEQQLR